jgi:hypothetical protein
LVILEMGVLCTFCQGWPWSFVLPISVFQVARITGVHSFALVIFWIKSIFPWGQPQTMIFLPMAPTESGP